MLQTNPPALKKVMISSTARDLPEHRKVVLDACLRQGMFPIMMEHLPAGDADAISESLRMVNEADLYLGIFAFRYGYIPKGYDISVTEMEYNRAVERGIPRLLFLMHEKHPVTVSDIERGVGATKLDALKVRQKTERVVNFFKSPEELHALVINSLSSYRRPDLTAFHYVSDIPEPPEPYIAHPYTLLQTKDLIGRQAGLNLLTDWVAQPASELYQARILSLVAIGGMGKSALAWKWFHNIAPLEMQPLAGRLWWSFYESDATFENFVTRALAYVSKRTLEDVQKYPLPEREAQLLSILDHESFLLVLDGLERLLIAYARMDAARLADDDLDQRTANIVADSLSLPESAAQSFTGQHLLRRTADLRTGAFLRKLATVRSTRVLVSTRLYPADLQTDTGAMRSGCHALLLYGLTDDDALNLWRAFGISGSREALLPLFHTFDNHPLLIQVLAGEIAHDRHTPGNFDDWQKNHPDFTPFHLPMVQVRTHILDIALGGLDTIMHQVLYTIAAFRMPASYDTLVALFVGPNKPCRSESALIAILTDLEDRGLLGWDRRANRYDLHPIVRGVTWSGLGNQDKQGIYQALTTHFEALPMIENWRKVQSLEDLTPAIELYNTLVGLDRYDDAEALFSQRLNKALLYRLGANRQRTELLEMLFPDGLDQLPRLRERDAQAHALNSLALTLRASGRPGQAASLLRRSFDIRKEFMSQQSNLGGILRNLSYTLYFVGALYESESAALRALRFARQEGSELIEVDSLYFLGLTLASRGMQKESKQALDRSLEMAVLGSAHEPYDYMAMCALWSGQYRDAQRWANEAMAFNQRTLFERGVIRAARLQGEAALGLGDLLAADKALLHALARARAASFVEEELAVLIRLAELRRRQGHMEMAQEMLNEVWEAAELGPFRLLHSDAYNILTQVQRDVGDDAKSIISATLAYQLAWCDGPPFAYHWGLREAKAHLAALGSPEPILPPFTASKYVPMPLVEIEPSIEPSKKRNRL